MRVYSIGHGSRSFEEFAQTLACGAVVHVADVRRFPGSRRHPQFGRKLLAEALAQSGIDYTWLPQLGGRRSAGPEPSPNSAWRVAGFRNFADHMDSTEFHQGLGELLALAARGPTAYLCAETHWSQCHRRLISDKLWSLGHEVVHLITAGRAERHEPTSFMRRDGDRLRYDLEVEPLPGRK